MTDTRQFAEQLAVKTGKLLTSYFHLEGIDPQVKADRSVVTEADLAADKFIQEAIRANYPEDEILTEETDPGQIDPDKALWVVDPLDGTANFSLGLPLWGVSIARLVNGMPQAGALNFPILSELYSASDQDGAYLNGRPLKVQPLRPEMPTAFFTCCSTTLRKYDLNIRYKTRMLGATAYDFGLVARGAALAGFHVTPKIWDFAAGWLVLEQAGGYAEVYPEGQPFPYSPAETPITTSFVSLLAADKATADKLRPAITPKKSSR